MGQMNIAMLLVSLVALLLSPLLALKHSAHFGGDDRDIVITDLKNSKPKLVSPIPVSRGKLQNIQDRLNR